MGCPAKAGLVRIQSTRQKGSIQLPFFIPGTEYFEANKDLRMSKTEKPFINDR
jgi:hypothetical protein